MSKIKRCVTVLIPYDGSMDSKDNKFLVLEHVKCKYKFTFPAGTCELYEKESDTVIREMMEELGLDIKYWDTMILNSRMAYYDRIDGHKPYLETSFMVRKGSQEVKNMEPDKHPSMKWVTLREIFDNPQKYTYNTWLTVAEMLRVTNELDIME